MRIWMVWTTVTLFGCLYSRVDSCLSLFSSKDKSHGNIISSRSLKLEGEDFLCTKDSNTSNEAASASNKLFVDLYKTLGKKEGNFLISPLSIFSGLSLLQLGTAGDTKSQWASSLHHNGEKLPGVHGEVHHLLKTMDDITKQTDGECQLNSANNVFIDDQFTVLETFREKVECFYRSDVETLPIQNNPQLSSETINNWISNHTNDKIKNLVSKESLGGNTQAVLINTIYFKAPWVYPFNKFATKTDQEFTKEDGTKVLVDMMALEKNLYYARMEEEGFTVVELKYDMFPVDETDLAMYLFIPDQGSEISTLEKALVTEDILNGKSLQLRRESLRLEMPRFEIRHQENLLGALSDLNLNPAGDFSRMTSQRTQLSDVLHQAYLRVDEEGSEGAAATALFMSRMLFIPRVEVRVDKTFLLTVVHIPSRVILFMGKVDQPDRVKEKDDVYNEYL